MHEFYQVQVGRRGVITFPKELRDQHRIDQGDVLNLMTLGDGVFVLSMRRSQVDEIADKLAKEWRISGASLENMLADLREVREAYDAQNG